MISPCLPVVSMDTHTHTNIFRSLQRCQTYYDKTSGRGREGSQRETERLTGHGERDGMGV